MPQLGVLPDGNLVEIWQVRKWDEEKQEWIFQDLLIDGTPIETQTFLPFLWGYSTWDRAIRAFQAGTIRNVNDMTRKWRIK